MSAIIGEERSHAPRDASRPSIPRPACTVGGRPARLARAARSIRPRPRRNPAAAGHGDRRGARLGRVRCGQRGLSVFALLLPGIDAVHERPPAPALPAADHPGATRSAVVPKTADGSIPSKPRPHRQVTRSTVVQKVTTPSHLKLADRRQSLRRGLHHQAESAVSGPRQGWLPPDLSHLLGPADGSAARALWTRSGEGYPPLPAQRSGRSLHMPAAGNALGYREE
jgi:hypothetical protein